MPGHSTSRAPRTQCPTGTLQSPSSLSVSFSDHAFRLSVSHSPRVLCSFHITLGRGFPGEGECTRAEGPASPNAPPCHLLWGRAASSGHWHTATSGPHWSVLHPLRNATWQSLWFNTGKILQSLFIFLTEEFFLLTLFSSRHLNFGLQKPRREWSCRQFQLSTFISWNSSGHVNSWALCAYRNEQRYSTEKTKVGFWLPES